MNAMTLFVGNNAVYSSSLTNCKTEARRIAKSSPDSKAFRVEDSSGSLIAACSYRAGGRLEWKATHD